MGILVVCVEWLIVMEEDDLCVVWILVFVEDLNVIFCCDVFYD